MCSELEIVVSERRLVSITKRLRWPPPYQTDKTVHVHAKHYKRGRMNGDGCARSRFRTAEPLGERRYDNWITTTIILGKTLCPLKARKRNLRN